MPTINATPWSLIDYTPQVSGSQPITFALDSTAPAWLSINQLSGRVTGTVPAGQPAGPLNFDILAQNCFRDGQPGNTVRQPMTIIIGSECQPVSIYDSNTASCLPLRIESTTFKNTIAKGQVTTDFTIRAEGDDAPGQPIILWTNAAGATLARVPGTERDYKLQIASANLEDGTYDYPVYGSNCRPISGTPVATTERRFTVVVGTGVGGPPSSSGGGGGNCTAVINAPGSHPIDRPLDYQMEIAAGGSCGAWQTWLLYAGETGGTAGTGSVPGQIDSVGLSPGSYRKDVSNLAPGNYVLWAKCNDPSGATCRDTFVTKPITLTAAGTAPGTGNPGTPCKEPRLVPIVPVRFSMRPGSQISFEVWLTEDSPVEGVTVTASDDIAGSSPTVAHLQTTVAWIEGRRFNLTIAMPTRDILPVSTFTIRAVNPCGRASYQMVVDRDDDTTPIPNCTPATVSTPPTTQITQPSQVVNTLIPYTGNLPSTFSPTHPNVWFVSWYGNTIKAEGEFAYGSHDVVVSFRHCDNSVTSVVWNIRPA